MNSPFWIMAFNQALLEADTWEGAVRLAEDVVQGELAVNAKKPSKGGNCGTGAGGFKPGNKCSKGGGGGSKVVGKDGKLKVVYHGTHAKFDDFGPAKGSHASAGLGIHFGSKEQAVAFAAGGGRVIPVHLDIKNPALMPDETWISASSMGAYAKKKNLKGSDKLKNLAEEDDRLNMELEKLGNRRTRKLPLNKWLAARDKIYKKQEKLHKDAVEEFKAALQASGYDGIKYRNEHEGKGYSWIVFSPSQIKRAGDDIAYNVRNGRAVFWSVGYSEAEDDSL